MDDGGSPPGTAPSLARFACDYCRTKKLKCSREIPKCANCRLWPGTCVYSKIAKSRPTQNSARVNITRSDTNVIQNGLCSSGASSSSIDRTQLSAEERLQPMHDTLSNYIASRTFGGDEPPQLQVSARSSTEVSYRSDQNDSSSNQRVTPLDVEQFHSFAAMDKARDDLQHLKDVVDTKNSPSYHAATTSLNELSKSVKSAKLHDGKLASRGYFVPSRPVGYKLMSRFLETAELAEILSAQPSDSLLQAIIFNPDSVNKPGWVVWVNFLLLNLVWHDDSDDSIGLVAGLRNNTRIALDDARIFLEPSEANIQALMLLGCHGEDYASPNLSWMLMGHACRQAQALGLHKPKAVDAEDRQRQLALFWSLFMVDKTCSLAFGRPTLLPTTIYRDVPAPDFSFLQKFQPHRPGKSFTQAIYGAHFFCQNIDLAKLAGHVLDLLGGGNSTFDILELIEKIDAWGLTTSQLLSSARDMELSRSTDHQCREMSIGMRAMEFQRLHLLLLLLQGNEHYALRRLAIARQTISLLPSLVSNSSQVYNGIVWQLLYYPFAAFFTIFHHVTTHPYEDVTEDVEALKITVSYFSDMRKEIRSSSGVCVKLEQTANVFHILATFIVEQRRNKGNRDVRPRMAHANTPEDDSIDSPYSSLFDLRSFADPFTSFLQSQHGALVDPSNVDVDGILDCLDTGPDMDSRGQKRPFDSAFDWFSWDSAGIGGDMDF